jgi:hypothetical protein
LVSNIKGITEIDGFENRELRSLFVPESEELIGEWRKLHSEELYNLYSLLKIIRLIKSGE